MADPNADYTGYTVFYSDFENMVDMAITTVTFYSRAMILCGFGMKTFFLSHFFNDLIIFWGDSMIMAQISLILASIVTFKKKTSY